MGKKRYLGIIALIVLLVSIVGISVRINAIKAENKERAVQIREDLLGCAFEGERRITKTVDKGGAIKLSAFTDLHVICEITADGEAVVTVTKSMCDGIATTVNGKIMYDDVEVVEKKYEVGEVEIELSGVIYVNIGKRCSVYVDEDGKPVQIIVEDVICDLIQ